MNTNKSPTSLAFRLATSFPETAFSWDDCVGSAVASELSASDPFFADHGWEFPYVIIVATELPPHEVRFNFKGDKNNVGIYESVNDSTDCYEQLSLHIINDSRSADA